MDDSYTSSIVQKLQKFPRKLGLPRKLGRIRKGASLDHEKRERKEEEIEVSINTVYKEIQNLNWLKAMHYTNALYKEKKPCWTSPKSSSYFDASTTAALDKLSTFISKEREKEYR